MGPPTLSKNVPSKIPHFVLKIWKMVNDPSTDHLISWNKFGNSFFIHDEYKFVHQVLPVYFQQNFYESFVRSLYYYGFRRVPMADNPEDTCLNADGIKQYYHPKFQRNKPKKLAQVKRLKDLKFILSNLSAVQNVQDIVDRINIKQLNAGQSRLDSKLAAMQKDQAVFWKELVILRQKHRTQQQIVNKVIQFLDTLVQPTSSSLNIRESAKRHLSDKPDEVALNIFTHQEKNGHHADVGELVHLLPQISLIENGVASPYSSTQFNMEKAEERFKIIFKKFDNSNIDVSDLHKLTILKKLQRTRNLRLKFIVLFILGILIYTLCKNIYFFTNSECFIDMPQETSKLFRAPEYCDFCEGFSKVDKIANISPELFLEKYVKHAHPVVITDGALTWPAMKLFNFDFFKELFNSIEINRSRDKNCQFFPYKTEFESLQDVFNMNKDRAMLKPGEKSWYVGWNNCNDEAGRYLKQFYDRPYFLSNMTENIALSWIFMGGPGHGAHMHVDNVHYPSWQAQLRGKKIWKLAPPPECYYKCKEIDVTVEPGEIIALDTNRWYHQTIVLPGEISITIGSEFD